jgi:hypothetical protein
MGLTGMLFLQEYPRAHLSQGEKVIYKNLEPSWGGLVSVGYDFSRSFSVNLFGGLRVLEKTEKTYFHAGVDLELTPFRVPISSRHDLIELGIIFGGSTALAAKGKVPGVDDNWGTVHVGTRVGINITPEFGITAAARANLGHVMFEGGLTARL